MDGKEGLQLLPGTKKRLGIKVPGENRFLYIGSAILGAVLVTMFAFSRQESLVREEISKLNDEIAAIEQKRNKSDENDLRVTKERLTLTSDMIKNHLYWTEQFSWLENMLQSEVQIEDMAVSLGKELTFSAKASGYTVIARQIAAFLADNRVKNLSVGKMTATSQGVVEFDMQLDLDLNKIIKK